jgi:hypothetical protein
MCAVYRKMGDATDAGLRTASPADAGARRRTLQNCRMMVPLVRKHAAKTT